MVVDDGINSSYGENLIETQALLSSRLSLTVCVFLNPMCVASGGKVGAAAPDIMDTCR